MKGLLVISRGTALVLLAIYIAYLYFQLVSHKDLFDSAKDPGNLDSPLGERGSSAGSINERTSEHAASGANARTGVVAQETGEEESEKAEMSVVAAAIS